MTNTEDATYGIVAAVLVGIGMGLVAAVLFEKHVIGREGSGNPSWIGTMIVPMTPRGYHRSDALQSPLYTPPPGGYSHAVQVPLSPSSPNLTNHGNLLSQEGESPALRYYNRSHPPCSPTVPPSLKGQQKNTPSTAHSPPARISPPGARVTVNTSPSQIEGVAHLSPRKSTVRSAIQ